MRRRLVPFCMAAAFGSASWLPSQSLDAHRFATPQPGATQKLTFDARRERMVRVDSNAYANLFETWEWLANDWSLRHTASKPPPRSDFSLGYDEARQRIVLHSGQGNPAPADLWTYDGTTWNVLGSAPARDRHELAFDPVRGLLFAVGGYQQSALGTDTLLWDGAVWTSRDHGLGWEDLRGAWFDGIRQRIVALSVFPLSWLEWDGSSWSRQASPVALVNPRGAFDPVRHRTVVVGADIQGIVTQEWDGTVWTPALLQPLPCTARPTFDQSRGKLVASCGVGGLWEWNGATWAQFANGPGAPWNAVADGECVYDAGRGELVQVQWQAGGIATARWNGVNWTVGTSPGPAQRSEHAFAYDPRLQRVVLFGGTAGIGPTGYYDDWWEWDGVSWMQRVLATTPPARARGVLVFDEAQQQVLLFGGQRDVTTTASVPFTDTWTLDSRPNAAVMALGPGCGGANGPLRLVPGVPHAGAAMFGVEAHGAFANAPCMFGFAFQAGAVPISTACMQWLAGLEVSMFTWCDAAGIALVTGSLPRAALGTTWAAQAAVLDPSNALGVTLSDGVLLTAGY